MLGGCCADARPQINRGKLGDQSRTSVSRYHVSLWVIVTQSHDVYAILADDNGVTALPELPRLSAQLKIG
jgi:hypothetical protein